MTRVAIKAWDELTDRVPAHALVSDVDLVVVRVDDSARVLYGRCAHRGALMADGYVDGDNLICGVHYWDYRLDSGVSEYRNSERLEQFTAWVEDGHVLVDEDEISAWARQHPQPYNRDAYQGAFQDPTGTADEPHVKFIRALANDGLTKVGHHGPAAAMGVSRRSLPVWDDLQPSLRGLTTGVLHAGPALELELNLVDSQFHARTVHDELTEALHGQQAGGLAHRVQRFLVAHGVEDQFIPEAPPQLSGAGEEANYSPECAQRVGMAWSRVTNAMEEFRSGIREETSQIQLWPHHFDLAMTWLTGDKIAGQEPTAIDNAEYADKQMAFGFTLGDEAIAEPYFYVSAYPLPDAFPTLPLPKGATWHTAGFQAALLLYRVLRDSRDAWGNLLELWRGLLSAGHTHLRTMAH